VSLHVVDASVVVKWFVPEIHSDVARQMLTTAEQLMSPDLLFPEVGNTVWKKVRRGELAPGLAERLVADITRIGVETVPSRDLLVDAHALAVHTGLTVYDATYLALAIRLDATLVTADRYLERSVTAHPPIARHVRLLQAPG
jgi:predicted nucleic acid-binding protein